MNWVNFSGINSSNEWQYTPEFSGEIVRLRHLISQELPYGAVGLIAQNFNNADNLELHNVKKIFPFYGNDILTVINPFKSSQRLAIRGQTKYKTSISWTILVDVWQGESSLINSESLNFINQQLFDLSTSNLTTLTDKLTTIQDSLGSIDTDVLAQLGQLDAGIFTLFEALKTLIPASEANSLEQSLKTRLDLGEEFL